MTTFLNSASHRLVFAGITNPATGRTLALDPGQTVDLDDDPEIANLTPATAHAVAQAAKHQTDVVVAKVNAGSVAKMKDPELLAMLRSFGLDEGGKIADRRARLAEALAAAQNPPDAPEQPAQGDDAPTTPDGTSGE